MALKGTRIMRKENKEKKKKKQIAEELENGKLRKIRRGK